jgi:type VI secretion system secreted protein Hcp
MAWDAFLILDDTVKGESRRAGHEEQIELISFSFGASNPASIGVGSGGGSGTVSLSSFNIMKKTDASSVGMFKACCLGQHFPTASIELYKSGGDALLYLKFDFEEVFVDNIQWSGAEGGDGVPLESVSFSFGKVEVTYTKQAPDGTADGDFVSSWDIRAGTE